MSDDFSASIGLLADLDLEECAKCNKPTETIKLTNGICSDCQKKASKNISTSVKTEKTKYQSKSRQRRSTSKETLKKFETKISEQQKIIDRLTSENEDLKSQSNHLVKRIHEIEIKVTNSAQKGISSAKIEIIPEKDHQKIIMAFYWHEKKEYLFFTSKQITDQLLLKMIVLIETSLNSAEQIQALEIIGDNYIQDQTSTLTSEVSEFIRSSAISFNKTFFPISNERIKKLGRKALHCEILKKSYNSDLIQVYKPTDLGKRFFKIRATYFAKEQVIKRMTSTFGKRLLAEKGKNLYKVIYEHINEYNTPVTRQELFNHYKLGKYDIDTFKHNLIELGLIKRVPLPLKRRYSQNRRLPRYEIALQPRYPEISPIDIMQISF